jgi:hypothetical protein
MEWLFYWNIYLFIFFFCRLLFLRMAILWESTTFFKKKKKKTIYFFNFFELNWFFFYKKKITIIIKEFVRSVGGLPLQWVIGHQQQTLGVVTPLPEWLVMDPQDPPRVAKPTPDADWEWPSHHQYASGWPRHPRIPPRPEGGCDHLRASLWVVGYS